MADASTDLGPRREPLTEPLPLSELARKFLVSRRTMATKILPSITAAVRVGGLWRVPLSEMPVGYWVEHGLIEVTRVGPPKLPTNASEAHQENLRKLAHRKNAPDSEVPDHE